MQKFVCRQATDVSQLLPLAIPTNPRQQQGINKNVGGQIKPSPRERLSPQQRRQRARLALGTLARVHGIMFAVKQTSQPLFAEFVSALGVKAGQEARVQLTAEQVSLWL